MFRVSGLFWSIRLTKLFKAFDSNGDGYVTLSTMLLADKSSFRTGGEWESRQARILAGLLELGRI